MPPPDLPPVRQVAPGDLKPSGAGVGSGGGGGGGGTSSRDPHWVWVPTSVLICVEAYWARYRQALAAAGDPEDAEQAAAARERVSAFDMMATDDWKATHYLAFVAFEHADQDPDRVECDEDGRVLNDGRLYAHGLLHLEGVREMVELEIAEGKREQNRAGATGMKRAIRARIAPLVDAKVLAALEEVGWDAEE